MEKYMSRVSENNYLHLLQESIVVLNQVLSFLDKDRTSNNMEIAGVGHAIKSLQGVIQNERRKSYQKRVKKNNE